MTEKRNYELDLQRIVDGMVEAILEAPEKEIDEELREAGIDPDVAAEGLRAKLERTVKKQHAARSARAHHRIQKDLFMMEVHPFELPENAKERMRLLGALLHRKPQLEKKLALQVEDLENLPDEDVTTYLRQLAESGALDDPPDGED